MNIVIPMAGKGSRFQAAGYDVPKPLIQVLDRPMYSWACDSLPLSDAAKIIFVLLETMPECVRLASDIEVRYGQYRPKVIYIPKETEGQALTVLAAGHIIDKDEPLLIHNADTAFSISKGWADKLLTSSADGALLVFESAEPRWSYSRENGRGRVVEVREKVVISSHASTGTYWFRDGRDFVRLASRRCAHHRMESSEYYVGPIYNDMIAEGKSIVNVPIQDLYCFGTPNDLKATLNAMAARAEEPR